MPTGELPSGKRSTPLSVVSAAPRCVVDDARADRPDTGPV